MIYKGHLITFGPHHQKRNPKPVGRVHSVIVSKGNEDFEFIKPDSIGPEAAQYFLNEVHRIEDARRWHKEQSNS